MTSPNFEAIAEQLDAAWQGRAPIAPITGTWPDMDAAGAYAIQTHWTKTRLGRGETIVGRKIGLTSQAIQQQLGVSEPDYGTLWKSSFYESEDGKVAIPASDFLQPRIEGEVAFLIGKSLKGPGITPEQVLEATEACALGVEIVDSRIADWKITFADTVADNGSSAFFVLGQERKPLDGLDLYTCGMVLEVNGTVASLGAGAACLGHPLNSAAWLARTLSRLGEPLRAGDILLTGALGPMVALKPGDAVVAKIGGLGSVAFHYEGNR